MRLLLAAACLFVVGSSPTLAAWAVAQSGHEQPYWQRFRLPDMAHDDAMSACSAHYPNCRVVVSGNSGCVAIATTGSQWGVAWAGSQARADDAAMRICDGLNAGSCTIEHQFCGR